jgi:hypothetical protein
VINIAKAFLDGDEHPERFLRWCFGGGPSQQQKDAAAAQANLANTQAQTAKTNNAEQQQMYNDIRPLGTSMMQNGLPFLNALTDYNNGTTAMAALPARASLLRSIGGNNSAQPNGFKAGAISDFDERLSRDFDSNISNALMANQNAKLQGANILAGQQGVLNPLGWSSASSGSNNSIMNAPLATPSPFGSIMGAVGSVGQGMATAGKF